MADPAITTEIAYKQDKISSRMSEQDRLDFVSSVKNALAEVDPDVQQRNLYMNLRDWYLYGDGLWENLEIPDGFDRTLYNMLPRVVDIHTSQLMGRPFQLYSYYEKEDISNYEPNDPNFQSAVINNKRKKADADSRKKMVDAIIRDNGGADLWKHGARLGSAYGTTVYKMWWDNRAKTIKISLLEAPQNYRAGWRDTNFRERDYDAYVYQISYSDAMRQYGQYLPPGTTFESQKSGDPLNVGANNLTSDPLDQNRSATNLITQTYRDMVIVIDITGYIDEWGNDGKTLTKVDRGDEQKVSTLIVGGIICQTIIDEAKMPRYYVINNRKRPRRAWGDSDLPDSALQINATYIERMSDYITIANKTLFPMIQAKGFEPGSVPKKAQRKMTVVPMAQEQSLEVVNLPTNFGGEYGEIVTELKNMFAELTGVGSMLFSDPTLGDSNQAAITNMKGIVDIVEDKQTRWEPIITEMMTDALQLAAKYDKNIAQVIPDDEYWYFYLQWPSVLRREDPSYQTMYINRFNAGLISVDSYLEAMGVSDVSEELSRIRDNMNDPIIGSIIGKGLSEVASMNFKKSLGLPPWGYVVPHITLAADMTPEQEANMAQGFGWNTGPYGGSIGPQGLPGKKANTDVINQGMIQGGDAEKYGGMPTNAANPQVNPQAGQPGQSQGAQPMSQPGSGAPAVTPQGAINQTTQQSGG